MVTNRLLSSAFAAALTLGAAGANATDQVSDIRLSALPGMSMEKGLQVHIQTSETPRYHMFRLSNPTRLVFDIRGADVAAANLPKDFGSHDLVSAVTATQFQGPDGKVSRVVVVLRADAEVQPTAGKDGIRLTLVNNALTESSGTEKGERLTSAAPSDSGMIELSGEGETPSATVLQKVRGVDQKGASLVQLLTDGQVVRYEVEEVENPPRLVVDLYGIKGPKALNQPLHLPGLKRVRASEHPQYTRIVVEGVGNTLPAYDVASTSDGIQLVFADPNAARPNTRDVQISSLTHVEKEGFERVSLQISDSVAVRTVANAPGQKTIALSGVKLSDDLLGTHRFEGSVATSMTVVADEHQPDSVRITLNTPTDVEHSVWQKDGKLLWDVRAKSEAKTNRVQPRAAPYAHTVAATAREGTAARRYSGRKITIDLVDAEIINVLRLLGDVSGKNIVVGDDVKGKVSIKLKNVPWDQALDVILRTKSFDKEVKGGIIRIAPAELLAKEREARLAYALKKVTAAPTSVRLIPVNYGVAEELVPQIKELLSKERGRVTFDARTNVIIVEDIRENLDQAQQLVRTLDTKTPQVLIEARMIEAQTTFKRQLGIQWGGNLTFAGANGNPTGLVFPSTVHTAGGLTTYQPALITAPQDNIGVLNEIQPNFAINMPTTEPTSAIGMTLGSVGNIGLLNARISAAEVSGELKVVSAPKVTTLNNKTAIISQGVENVVPVVAQNTVTFRVVEAVLKLEVTPHVTADGAILMSVDVSNNSLAADSIPGLPPNVITKEAKTELLVHDGDTAVIGGVFTRTTRNNVKQTPLLGDIPLLGWLFKSKSEEDGRNEMLIFITPRIVTQDNSF